MINMFTPDYDCIRSSVVAIVSHQLSIGSIGSIGSRHCIVGCDVTP